MNNNNTRSPLRIVHCFRSPVGGIFRHVRDLAVAQAGQGHQVGIVCDASTGGAYEDSLFAQIEPHLGLGVCRIAMQRHIGIGDLTSAYNTYKAIKGLEPDVLHGHGAKGGAFARVFGSRLRSKTGRPARIYSPHGGSLHYDKKSLGGRIFFSIERNLERWTDHLLFVSGQECKLYEQKIGTPRCKHKVVYNGLHDEEFNNIVPEPDAADFVYVGMMRDLKGPDIFIEAFMRVQDKSDQALSAVMIGDGDDKKRYIQTVKDNNLADHVTFFDAMPIRHAFAKGNIVVVPSRAEAMPYTVLEAVAGGKTMIAARVGGIPEIFGTDNPALVSPDAKDIAEKMFTAHSNPEDFARHMPPKDELRQRFGVDVMAKNVFEAYQSALTRLA